MQVLQLPNNQAGNLPGCLMQSAPLLAGTFLAVYWNLPGQVLELAQASTGTWPAAFWNLLGRLLGPAWPSTGASPAMGLSRQGPRPDVPCIVRNPWPADPVVLES